MADKKVIKTTVGDLVVAGYDWLEPFTIPTETKTAIISALVQDMRRRDGGRRSDLLHNPVR